MQRTKSEPWNTQTLSFTVLSEVNEFINIGNHSPRGPLTYRMKWTTDFYSSVYKDSFSVPFTMYDYEV